ncbi:MAG: 50S ribosomal protein L4 [Legionellales bacterium]|nr:50S ribosomal protein L4 [Legionellales bacterium]|tara:strand:- start:546 stop:1160 length:615 start_codon:yes stop_codon:yes gene_type:complete
MKLAVQTAAGKQETISVSEQFFGRDYNEALVHQVALAQMAPKKVTKGQKNRSAVSGGGVKPWRQKGTGRARAGSIRSPLWRGGGRTFPSQPRDINIKVNKKMFRGALSSVMSELIRQERLTLVDQVSVEAPKTKLLVQLLKDKGFEQNLLIVTEYIDENLYLASRNLPGVQVIDAASMTPYDGVRHERVVMTTGALKKIEEALA